MIDSPVMYVDYIGNKKYGIFIEDPLKDHPDHVMTSVTASLEYITKRYGIDTKVEVSHCAEIIFKVEVGMDIDGDLS